MPGSIHVSVIDFSELPSSSPSSSILVKASLGKSEHQIWGKGEFSLQLKRLRDNVSITLYDAEEKELSHTDIQIITIVEKGCLDKSISLEGGGNMQLKLRFVLNEEERNKIRKMRESATKRKRDELLSASPRFSKIASTTCGTVTTTTCVDNEVSVKSTDDSAFLKADLATPKVNKDEELLEKSPIKDKTDESEDKSLRRVRVGDETSKKKNEKIKDSEEKQSRLEEKNELKLHLHPINFPKRPVLSRGTSPSSKRDLAAFEVKKDVTIQAERPKPLQKTSSSVRKMISAFESSLFKEMKPVIKPPPVRAQPDNVGSGSPSYLDLTDTTEPTGGTSNCHKHFLVPSPTEPTKLLFIEVKTPLADENSKIIENYEMKTEECIGTDSSQEASRLEEPLKIEDSIGKTLKNETNTLNSCAYEFSSSETSGVWIFPDEGSRSCITTEIKQVADCRMSEIYIDMNKSAKTSLCSESSPGAETSNGLIGQAIKIAIMVAFGSLVLLTRQTKPR